MMSEIEGLGAMHGVVSDLLTTVKGRSSSVAILMEESEAERLELELTQIAGWLAVAETVDAKNWWHVEYTVELLRGLLYRIDDLLSKGIPNASNSSNKVSCFSGSIKNERRKQQQQLRSLIAKLDYHQSKYTVMPPNRYLNITPTTHPTPSSDSDSPIGRSDEVDAIVNLLNLDCDCDRNCHCVSFVHIAGMTGLGKTTVARLVYNHHLIIHNFHSRRFWVPAYNFNLNTILAHILTNANSNHPSSSPSSPSLSSSSSTDEDLERRLVQELQCHKFLLILDDLWCEDAHLLHRVHALLTRGARGSRVVVTTRSSEFLSAAPTTSTCSCTRIPPYYLPGLSDDHSWQLFQKVAFNDHQPSGDYLSIGKEIVKLCCNVPSAIVLVATHLKFPCTDWTTWANCQRNQLAWYFCGRKCRISSTLKPTYNALPPSVRSCFCYCALFPRGYEFHKDMLISLWIAQGYIVPLSVNQTLEDAGEEYISMLKHRFFFQDVKWDEYGDIVSFKIHTFFHDLAQDVAGNEFRIIKPHIAKLPQKTRHIFHVDGGFKELFKNTHIRSYLQDGLKVQFPLSRGLENWICLRVLDLHRLHIQSLPHLIGKLKSLRYLDLSYNGAITVLPSSLTELYNLQTLNLSHCDSLKELPADFSSLSALRYLYISGCGFTHMPPGLEKLSCLRVLTDFVVADTNLTSKQCVGLLQALKAFVSLKGCIDISIPENANVVENDRGGGYLKGLKDLKRVRIQFTGSHSVQDHDTAVMHAAWLQMLQPHPYLRALILVGYQGKIISRWGTGCDWATLLPNLVKVELISCQGLKQIPSMSKLCFLKSLVLGNLTSVEYVEDESSCSTSTASGSSSKASELIFYPSLEYLDIWELSELKGWWKGVKVPDDQLTNSSNSWQPTFPRLYKLVIRRCPNLTSFPLCPSVETLCLTEHNEKLRIRVGEADMGLVSYPLSHSAVSYCSKSCLREVELDNLSHLKSLPIRNLASIHIKGAMESESVSVLGDVFQRCRSLQSLTIENCPNLTDLSGRLDHLSVLESLSVRGSLTLTSSIGDGIKNDILWRYLEQNLRFLEFKEVKDMQSLPSGIQQLTALQSLTIQDCGLRFLPRWICCLTSLECLRIISCYKLSYIPKGLMQLPSLQEVEIRGIITPFEFEGKWTRKQGRLADHPIRSLLFD